MEKKVCKCGHSDIIHEYYTDTCHAKGCSCLSFQEPNSNPPSPEAPERVRGLLLTEDEITRLDIKNIDKIVKQESYQHWLCDDNVQLNYRDWILLQAQILKLQQAEISNLKKQIFSLRETCTYYEQTNPAIVAEAHQQAFQEIDAELSDILACEGDYRTAIENMRVRINRPKE